MNHLVAKIKGKGNHFFKVISNSDFFILPEGLANGISFQASYKPDEDEWFSVHEFSEKEYCIDFVKHPFIATEYSQIPVSKFPSIKYLVAVQGQYYFFQNLSSSQIIEKKYFKIGNAPELVNNQRIIILETNADAIYDRGNDTLYFKNIIVANKIFTGIDMLFREATDAETQEFLNSDFISLTNGFTAESVKKPNRKRIALAKEALSNFLPDEKASIFVYIREYYPDLQFNDDEQNFAVANEDDLKKLTDGIEQKYYTTIVGNQRRRANSVRNI